MHTHLNVLSPQQTLPQRTMPTEAGYDSVVMSVSSENSPVTHAHADPFMSYSDSVTLGTHSEQ